MDVAKDVGKDAVEQIKDRFKIHYFSYIFTSLIAFNWQNILLLIMSDSRIEKLLGDWNGDPEFALDYFWIPIGVGYLASVILPALALPIAVVISYITSRLSESDEWIENLRKRRKASRAAKLAKKEKENDNAQRELEMQRNTLSINRNAISNFTEQKDNLENFLLKLSAVYTDYPDIDTEEGFKFFLEKVIDSNIMESYPGRSSIWYMLNKIRIKKDKQNPPPAE